MGVLLKFFLISLVGFWIVRSVLRFFLTGLFGRAQQQQQFRSQQQTRQRPAGGNVDVNYNPGRKSAGGRSAGDFKGGDYVDYEEVD